MDAVGHFQDLRNSVASITEANEGASTALRNYFEQIETAADKFPVSETSVKIAFTWSDTLRPSVHVSQYNWNYEKACVLYNMVSFKTVHSNTSWCADLTEVPPLPLLTGRD
jgi:hypothetical protein